MDFAEFDKLAEPLRQRAEMMAATYGLRLIEELTASIDEILDAEMALGVMLPVRYKTFMTNYGGGTFGSVDLFPIGAGRRGGGGEGDIVAVNRVQFPDAAFVAVAPVGTGDYWGFVVTDHVCSDDVWFHYHDGGEPTRDCDDFLSFVARYGIRR